MQNIIDDIGKKVKLPPTLKYIRSRVEDSIYNMYYDKRLRMNEHFIQPLKSIHDNERVFILGNGPSLNETNFDVIKNETFFAANAFYKGMSKFGIKPKYWAIGDGMLFEEHFRSILNLKDTKVFLTNQALKRYLERTDYFRKYTTVEPYLVRNIGDIESKGDFSYDLTEGIYVGGGIIPIMLQIAYFLGFEKMYLLGCDCGSKGKRSHHFYKSNSKPRADYSDVFRVYEICRDALEEKDILIVNSTVGGNLEVFKRKMVDEII